MNCKMIRDILSTNYIDGELQPSEMARIQSHLKTCPSCAQYEQQLRELVSQPFKGLEEMKPPAIVWTRIEQAIRESTEEQKDLSPSLLGRCKEVLETFLPMPRLAYAMALVIFFSAMSVIVLPKKQPVNSEVETYLMEQADFLLSLDNQNDTNAADTELNDLIS